MVKKSLVFVGFAGFLGALSAAGCSVTATLIPTDGGGGDGGASDAKTDAKEAAPPKDVNTSCFVEGDIKQYVAEITGPVKDRGLCTTKQVADFATACTGTAATNDTCKAYADLEANKPCLTCIQGGATGPVPALISAGGYVIPNVDACASLVIGKPECALPGANYILCQYSACETCADDTTRAACIKEAQAGACAQVAPSKECSDAFTAAKTQIDATCRGGTGFATVYPKVTNYLCGSGDGGTVVTDAAVDATPVLDATPPVLDAAAD